MTVFRLGQRVRIVSATTTDGALYIGMEAVITEVMCLPMWDGNGYGLDISPIFHDGECWRTWVDGQLEPISDSNELVSWESMRDLWVPEHLRVAA